MGATCLDCLQATKSHVTSLHSLVSRQATNTKTVLVTREVIKYFIYTRVQRPDANKTDEFGKSHSRKCLVYVCLPQSVVL